MKTCHIFCAAEFEGLLERPAQAIDSSRRWRPAASPGPGSGAHRHSGDFDSLGYTPQGPQVDRFPWRRMIPTPCWQ